MLCDLLTILNPDNRKLARPMSALFDVNKCYQYQQSIEWPQLTASVPRDNKVSFAAHNYIWCSVMLRGSSSQIE